MLLLLLRHADAAHDAKTDRARSLTEKGIAQAKRVGKFCLRKEIRPDVILTSPFRRAVETAQIIGTTLGVAVVEAPFLAAGMPPDTALAELAGHRRLGTVMIVGHEPDFGDLAARLLGASTSARLRVRKASLTAFEIDNFAAGGGVLHYLVPAALM